MIGTQTASQWLAALTGVFVFLGFNHYRILAVTPTRIVVLDAGKSRVLETASIHPATPARDGLPAEASYQLSDTYLSIRWTNTRPIRNPYRG